MGGTQETCWQIHESTRKDNQDKTEFYTLVDHSYSQLSGDVKELEARYEQLRSQEAARRRVDAIKTREDGRLLNRVIGGLDTTRQGLIVAARITPILGTAIDAAEGNTTEALLSAAGDLSLLVGVGAVDKVRKLGKLSRAWKIGVSVSTIVEGGAVGYNIGKGVKDLKDEKYWAATAHFGEAGLRLLGITPGLMALWKSEARRAALAARAADNCFAAGTPLLTPTGSKPIEQFVAGDLLLSRDEHDPRGEVQAKAVEEVFARLGQTLEVKAGGQVMRITVEHPLWVVGKGWVPARKVEAGDRLVGHDDQEVTVEEVVETGAWETVYNLRVADFHTYFVGCDEWGFSVWAHNSCYGEFLKALGKEHTPELQALYENAVKNPRMWKQFQEDLAKVAGEVDMSKVKAAWGTVQESAGLKLPPVPKGSMIDVPAEAVPGTHYLGGGAELKGLSPEHMAEIQAFADKTGTPVALVGSRVNGKVGPASDFDYIIGTINSKIRSQAMKDLPRGPKVERQFGQTSGMDIILDTPLDPTRPHIVFVPKK
ncbi:MAG: HINT domain-containing protein, partial [Gemmataceae bacterium]|nr:HINT domain-containing protein [Gemmataceae bacterium]